MPVYTNAVRMIYDELPNMHQIQTGEETKAVPLEAVRETKEQEEPVYIFEDGEGNEYIGRKVTDGDLSPTYTSGGQATIFLAEPEDGDLVPIDFSFSQKSDKADKVMDRLLDHVEVGDGDGELPEDVKQDIEEEVFELAEDGFTPNLDKYLIENKDERLNALAEHLANRLDKYVPEGWVAKLAEHKELLLVIGTGVALTMMFYVFATSSIGDAIPILQDIKTTLSAADLSQLAGSTEPAPGR